MPNVTGMSVLIRDLVNELSLENEEPGAKRLVHAIVVSYYIPFSAQLSLSSALV